MSDNRRPIPNHFGRPNRCSKCIHYNEDQETFVYPGYADLYPENGDTDAECTLYAVEFSMYDIGEKDGYEYYDADQSCCADFAPLQKREGNTHE